MAQAIGSNAFTNIFKDLSQMIRHSHGITSTRPANFIARVEAIVRKVEKAGREDNKQWLQSWTDSLFKNQGRMGHRWANSLNIAPSWAELGLSSQGNSHPYSHLLDRERHFCSLWSNSRGTAWRRFRRTQGMGVGTKGNRYRVLRGARCKGIVCQPHQGNSQQV